MTIQGSFGEQALQADTQLETLNRVWLPLLKKMLAAQNDCDCTGGGGGGNDVVFGLVEPAAGDDGDGWLETA